MLLQNRESQTLLPLTIKQINHALQSSDDRTGLTIDGVGVYTVRYSNLLL
jgi:hypothetical protein